MQTLFNNKYRIPSARLQHWNYANEAMYFVTICTKNRQHFFGDLPPESEKDSIILNPTEIGKIAHSEWYKTIELRRVYDKFDISVSFLVFLMRFNRPPF